MKKYLFTVVLLLLTKITFGNYLKDFPIMMEQTDGTKINVLVTGDEYYRRVHDSLGYTIFVINKQVGWYIQKLLLTMNLYLLISL